MQSGPSCWRPRVTIELSQASGVYKSLHFRYCILTCQRLMNSRGGGIPCPFVLTIHGLNTCKTTQTVRDVVHDVAARLRRNSRTSALEASSHGLHSNITRHGDDGNVHFRHYVFVVGPKNTIDPHRVNDLQETSSAVQCATSTLSKRHTLRFAHQSPNYSARHLIATYDLHSLDPTCPP